MQLPIANQAESFPLAYPGSNIFRHALNYYGQEVGPTGTGAGDLAGAAAFDPGAMQYQNQPGPAVGTGGGAQEVAQNNFKRLLDASAASQAAARGATGQVQQQGFSGLENTGMNMANAISGAQRGALASNSANSSQSGGELGMFSGLLKSAVSPTGFLNELTPTSAGGGSPGGVFNMGNFGKIMGMFGGGGIPGMGAGALGDSGTTALMSGAGIDAGGALEGLTGAGAGIGAGAGLGADAAAGGAAAGGSGAFASLMALLPLAAAA